MGTLNQDMDVEFFYRAAQHLQHYGWMKGKEGAARRPACAMGALFAVTGDWSIAYRLATTAETAKGLGHGILRSERLSEWNDKPERKAADVIGLFLQLGGAPRA